MAAVTVHSDVRARENKICHYFYKWDRKSFSGFIKALQEAQEMFDPLS